jgi:hypothetical protein
MKQLPLLVPSLFIFPALLLVIAGGTNAAAQTPAAAAPADPGIGLSYTVSASSTGKTKLKAGSVGAGEVSSGDFNTAINQSVTLAEGRELGVGVSYSRTSFDRSKGASATPLPERVQSLALDFSYTQKFDAAWSGLLGVSPGLHNAGTGFSSKGFGTSVIALGIYQVNPTLSIAAGAGYDSLAHGRNQFAPGFGLEWKPTKEWNVSFGYPKTGITYLFSDSLSLGLVAEGAFGTYYVEKDPLPGAAGRPRLADTTLEYFDARLGLSANWKVSKQFVVTLSTGSTVERQFDYHERKYKLKSDGTAGYATLGLTFVF